MANKDCCYVCAKCGEAFNYKIEKDYICYICGNNKFIATEEDFMTFFDEAFESDQDPFDIIRERYYYKNNPLYDTEADEKRKHFVEDLQEFRVQQAAKKKMAEFEANMPHPDKVRVKCPACGSSSVTRISGVGKVAKVGLFGLFGAGDLGKTYRCGSCGCKF